jgi:hypothetical protein
MIEAHYTLIQVVPNRLRNERVNVGVILQAPSIKYSGMRVRRWMDNILKRVFPEIDPTAIRMVIRGIQGEFARFDFKTLDRPLFDFVPTTKEFPYELEFINQYKNGYSVIEFSSPTPILIQDKQSLPDVLDQLNARLVEFQTTRLASTTITKEILEKNVLRLLYEHQIPVETKPPVFQGLQWKNKFDALQNKSNRRHLQFISFDISEAPIMQAKAFLASVEDMRLSDGKFTDDEFGCIVQAPKANSPLLDDYNETLTAYRKNGIATFQHNEVDMQKLIYGLNSDNGFRAVN